MFFKQPSFFTSSVIEALTPLLKQPTPSIFEAVTTIISRETQYSLKYLEPVLSAFVEAIKTNTGKELNTLFCQLEVIIMSVGAHISPHMPLLINELKNHISGLPCLRACITMPFELKAEFKPYASILYPIALRLMTADDKEYLKVLLKFICFTLIYSTTQRS